MAFRVVCLGGCNDRWQMQNTCLQNTLPCSAMHSPGHGGVHELFEGLPEEPGVRVEAGRRLSVAQDCQCA